MRTTAAAVAVVGIALVLASIEMVRFVDTSLTSQVADGAELRASELVASGAPAGTTISVGDRRDEYVQILENGSVVASSANVAGLPPLATPRPEQHVIVPSVPFVEGPFVAVALPLRQDTSEQSQVVVVGRSIDDVGEARRTVARALVFGVPALLGLIGVVTWWIVGRTLRPVEDIRSEVERISSRELHRRVPTPPAGDEVGRLALTMNRMLDRLERGQERQRRFVSDASHELRSPVASIRQHAEVAREHPGSSTVEDLAHVVLEEDARLQRIVEDLLLLAKFDERAETKKHEVDLDDIVLAEAARLRTTTTLAVDARDLSAGRVLGDREHLGRRVRNLTDNTARYARERAAFGLSEVDGHVVLWVDDDGPGIPVHERDRVLERFVRLDGARGRDTGGTGLGLSIVREVAVSHGGRVGVGESPLGGTRVEVWFPSTP